MKTNTFFTIFWMLYFPLCVAFYHQINFDWSDEILTLCIIIFAIFKGTFMLKKNTSIMKEVWVYLGLMTFYVVYSLLMAVNVEEAVWLDLQQQVRPYAVFYCTWILNPQFTKNQKRLILWMMIGCTLVYAVVWRGVGALEGVGNQSAIIGQLSLVTGMAWFLWSAETRKNVLVSIAICAIGIIGGKSKFFGEFITFVAIVYYLNDRIKLNSSKTVLRVFVLATVVLFFTWSKFNVYYVEGTDELGNKLARPETYKTAVTIVTQDYVPFGSGLGSFATTAAMKYYSPLYYKYKLDTIWGLNPEMPMFIMDAFYPTLAEFGIFGVVFFLIFWRRRLKAVVKLPYFRAYKVGLMCIFALALESVADSSYLSGKGMGYFMLLAICIGSSKCGVVKQGVNNI